MNFATMVFVTQCAHYDITVTTLFVVAPSNETPAPAPTADTAVDDGGDETAAYYDNIFGFLNDQPLEVRD